MFGIGGERDLTERELPHLAGLAGQRAGPGRQRRLDPAAARRVRRAARARPTAARPARRARPGDPAFLAACRRRRGRPVAGAGPGDLGDPRRAAALPVLQAHVLGRAGPGHRAGRPLLGAEDRVAAWTAARDEIRDGHPDQGWSEQRRGLHPVVRLRRARRVQPDAGHHRVPARRRPADAGDHRRHRGAAHRRARAGVPVPRPTTAWTATRAPSCCARSGWPRPRPWPASRRGPRDLRAGHRLRSTTSACWPRRSTRHAASCSATSRRRSATSAWSTRPGRSPRPVSGPLPARSRRPRAGHAARGPTLITARSGRRRLRYFSRNTGYLPSGSGNHERGPGGMPLPGRALPGPHAWTRYRLRPDFPE